jgi:K(+)-stimulated pyrophosphate-energized sodium pump
MKLMEHLLRRSRAALLAVFGVALAPIAGAALFAQEAQRHVGGEANLVVPDLGVAEFMGFNGRTLLMLGLIVCALGLAFGLVIYNQLKNMPVHKSMLEVSELIYETCKTYLITQGKFILVLEVFIGAVIAIYFGVLQHFTLTKVVVILLFSLIGIAGSYGVAWFGIRVNTFANSRTAFAALRGKPYPCYQIPLKAGMSIGMLLISGRAGPHARHPAVHSGRLRRRLLHRLRDR